MCSCCNVVSKYPASVKKHIRTQHTKRGVVKGIKSRVIPIRIENRFENVIKRTLDKGNSNRKLTEKLAGQVLESDDSFSPRGISRVVQIKNKNGKEPKSRDARTHKCSICNTHASNYMVYIKHVVTLHADRNIKINFQCPVCSDVFMFYTDIQSHVEETHSEVIAMVSYIECMNIEINKASLLLKQIQCPYCDQLFPELGLLHKHVKVLHFDNTGNVSIRCDIDEKKILGTTAEIVLTKYSCPTCGKYFHTLLDVREHCLTEHISSIANSKSARKRKPPKWLQSEGSHVTVKKQKTSQTSKQTDRKNSSDFHVEKLRKSRFSDSHSKDPQLSLEGLFEFKEVKTEIMEEEKVEKMKEEMIEILNENSGEKKVSLPVDADDLDFDEADFDNDFGDSSDDFVPDQSDSDSDESVKDKKESLDCISSIIKNSKKSRRLKSAKSSGKKIEDKEKYLNKYKCQFCEFYLYHHEYIRSHVQQSHPEVTNYRIFARKKIKLNSCENNWESFKCPNPKCNFASEKKAALQVHIADCANRKLKNEKIFCHLPQTWMERLENTVSLICFHCDDVVQGKKGYENHLREHFPGKTFEVQLNSTLPPPQIPNRKSKRLKASALKEVECSMCPYCEVVTTQKAQLTKHFKRFHSNESSSSVIFCVLANQSSVKETAKLIVKSVENDNTANFSESRVENVASHTKVADGTVQLNTKELSMDKWLRINQNVNIQSTVPVGIYMCPLCDDFKTRVKKDIKVHMDEHNSKTEEDIDSVFVIPDKWLKLDVKDGRLKCQFCDFTTDLNLTLGFRHILACHKDITMNELDQASNPLFKMLNVRIGGAREKYEKQKYRCTTCMPGFIFKTKKGLQLHLKSYHTDRDSLVVYESMYQMLDLIADSCK